MKITSRCSAAITTSSGLTVHSNSDVNLGRRLGWVDLPCADIERSLLIEDGFSGVEACRIRALLLDPSGHLRCSESGSGSPATIDDGTG